MIIRKESELNTLFERLEATKRYGIDVETVDRGFPNIQLTGTAISVSPHEGYYIPTGHSEGIQLSQDLVMGKLREFTANNPNKIAVMHNAKYDMSVLELVGGVKFSDNIFDTMVASWLLDTENPHGLKTLSRRYLNYSMTELEDISPIEKDPMTGDKVMRTDLAPIDVLGAYAIDDVKKPLELMDLFVPMLEADGLLKVFCELEMPKMHILKGVEMAGVMLDTDALQKRLAEAPTMLAKIEQEMYALRPNKQPFNAGSTKQLNEILFKEIGIPPLGKPGKSGMYSTSADNMEAWAAEYPIVAKIQEYRQVSKLFGTYLEGLTKRLGPDGRIRTRFNPILTTGRLSSSSPNLQNIPRPDNDKFGLRDMFIAGEGKKLVVADYSQVELRVLAHLSRDPIFVKAFTDDEDLHSYAAKMLFNLPEPLNEVKKLHSAERSIGKTFNFAMVFEAGIRTLARSTGVDDATAKELRAKYLARFGGIEKYINAMHARAEAQGYVSTLVGRKRHLKNAQLRGLNQDEISLKASALRQSSNSPVQGSAADILYIAMRNIRNRLRRENLEDKIKLVLQVHDELMYEVDEDLAEYARDLVKYEMENAVTLRVPLISEAEIGDRWSECK